MGRIFKFDLYACVTIAVSGEHGNVVGRAEYANNTCQYLVQYKNALGVAVEQWWAEDALRVTPEGLPA